MKRQLFNLESLVAILLSFVGGLLDIYCLYNYGLYGMLHTGNIIKLVVYIIDGDMTMILFSSIILISFIVGLFLVNFLKRKSTYLLLYLEIIILAIIILIPNHLESELLSFNKISSVILFGFIGALMLHCFIYFGDYIYTSTMMTANLSRLVDNLYQRIVLKDKSKGYSVLTYFLIIIFFAIGVASGYLYLKYIPNLEKGFIAEYEYTLILFVPLIIFISLIFINKKIDAKYQCNK